MLKEQKLAQLVERRITKREVMGLNPGRTITPGLMRKCFLCDDICKWPDFLAVDKIRIGSDPI